MSWKETSKASNPRKPGPKRERLSKGNGYALAGLPFYLLIDCDPRHLTVTLWSEPDVETGVYRQGREWPFGEAIVLAEPFQVEIPTAEWNAWAED